MLVVNFHTHFPAVPRTTLAYKILYALLSFSLDTALKSVMPVVNTFSSDNEPAIRQHLVEQLVIIAKVNIYFINSFERE